MTDNNNIIITAIMNALANPKQGAKYFERPRGSYCPSLRAKGSEEGAAAVELLQGLAVDGFEEVTEEVTRLGASFGKCRYFRASTPMGFGLEAAVMASELTTEQIARVKVVVASHDRPDRRQFELVIEDVPMRETDHLHVVIGNGDNPFDPIEEANVTVFTWFPGRVLPNVPVASATVKLG